MWEATIVISFPHDRRGGRGRVVRGTGSQLHVGTSLARRSQLIEGSELAPDSRAPFGVRQVFEHHVELGDLA